MTYPLAPTRSTARPHGDAPSPSPSHWLRPARTAVTAPRGTRGQSDEWPGFTTHWLAPSGRAGRGGACHLEEVFGVTSGVDGGDRPRDHPTIEAPNNRLAAL